MLFRCCDFVCVLFSPYVFLCFYFFFRSRDCVVLEVSVVEDESLDEESGSGLLFAWLPTFASGIGGGIGFPWASGVGLSAAFSLFYFSLLSLIYLMFVPGLPLVCLALLSGRPFLGYFHRSASASR